MGEGVDEALRLIVSMRQIVACMEFISPGRLGAFDAALRSGRFGGSTKSSSPRAWHSASKTDLNAPPST
jgi:hypothetical protein